MKPILSLRFFYKCITCNKSIKRNIITHKKNYTIELKCENFFCHNTKQNKKRFEL